MELSLEQALEELEVLVMMEDHFLLLLMILIDSGGGCFVASFVAQVCLD